MVETPAGKVGIHLTMSKALRSQWTWKVLVIVLMAGTAVLLLRAAWADSVTNDEGIYIHSGSCAYNTGIIDLEDTNPAGFKLLAGAGAALSGVPTDHTCASFSYTSFLAKGTSSDELRRLVFFARLPGIIITLALVALSSAWARQLTGRFAAVLAAALVGFDATVLAHGHIATGDIPLTFGMVGCVSAVWRWRRADHQVRWLVLAGLALGFALLMKASAVVLVPTVGIQVALLTSGTLKERLRPAVRVVLTVGCIAYLVLVLVYAPFAYTHPAHKLLPSGLDWLVPQSWLHGLIWQLHHVADSSETSYYLNGHHIGGSLLYFPEALLLKTTLAALLAMAIGLVVLARRDIPALVWCALPGAVIFVSAVESGIDIGIRYVAPSIVFWLIGAAAGISYLRRQSRLLGAGAVLAATITTAIAPVDGIGYFNQLAIGRDSYYLNDSNVDFGQDGWRLRDWWEAAGKPNIQVDFFGYLPARYYVPTAIDVGAHGERLDNASVADVPGRILIVSVNSSSRPGRDKEIASSHCQIGAGLVIVGAKDCRTGL